MSQLLYLQVFLLLERRSTSSLSPKVTGRYCRGVGDPECAKINGIVVLEFSNSALDFSIDLYSVSLIAH